MKRSIQDYLSLGYLYLLALGVIRDTVYYGFLDINIMSYTSILDVLLSPLVFLTKNIYIPVIIAVLIIGMWFLSRYLRRLNAKSENKGKVKLQISENNFAVLMVALVVFSMYFGAGLGQGQAISERIEENRLDPTHRLRFVNDKSDISVRLLGQNSQYLFFIAPGDSSVSIVPINGNIRRLTRLESLYKD